jgi:hypothetical protein
VPRPFRRLCAAMDVRRVRRWHGGLARERKRVLFRNCPLLATIELQARRLFFDLDAWFQTASFNVRSGRKIL